MKAAFAVNGFTADDAPAAAAAALCGRSSSRSRRTARGGGGGEGIAELEIVGWGIWGLRVE
jgi:hypothetical protein